MPSRLTIALGGRFGISILALQIDSCQHCHPDDAEIPFDWILQKVTGKSGMVDFMMLETAKCPNCKQTLTEKTLIESK